MLKPELKLESLKMCRRLVLDLALGKDRILNKVRSSGSQRGKHALTVICTNTFEENWKKNQQSFSVAGCGVLTSNKVLSKLLSRPERPTPGIMSIVAGIIQPTNSLSRT